MNHLAVERQSSQNLAGLGVLILKQLQPPNLRLRPIRIGRRQPPENCRDAVREIRKLDCGRTPG
jgi:hypothetical protein